MKPILKQYLNQRHFRIIISVNEEHYPVRLVSLMALEVVAPISIMKRSRSSVNDFGTSNKLIKIESGTRNEEDEIIQKIVELSFELVSIRKKLIIQLLVFVRVKDMVGAIIILNHFIGIIVRIQMGQFKY